LCERLSPIITCEHGGNRIPPAYRRFFYGQEDLLESHMGWDPGALSLARAIAKSLDAPLHASTVSRLLVELNRSPRHPSLFSRIARQMPPEIRHQVLAEEYRPYRNRVVDLVVERRNSGLRTLHLAIHTFTPELRGVVRKLEMGILYDPARSREKAFAGRWQGAIRDRIPESPTGIRVRRNRPYRGKSDGLPTWLRGRFPPEAYLGFEVEINQAVILEGGPRWSLLESAILSSLREMLQEERNEGSPIRPLPRKATPYSSTP
jgi:predicted N-formylglutamate amidohydrolase